MTRKTLTGNITLQESIGKFLRRRLREDGIGHVFGVAGDFHLDLLEQLEAADGLKWVGCCNERNAAYAVDAYARAHGLSALITTCGVGELSALCGIAGALRRACPIVAITGAPPMTEVARKKTSSTRPATATLKRFMERGSQLSVAQA